MICANFPTFRYVFAKKARTTATLTFNSGTPATITRASGSFQTDGFLSDHTVDIFNTASNNVRVKLAAGHPQELTLTLAAGYTLVNETVACAIEGKYIEKDGLERWEVSEVDSTADTMQGFPLPLSLPDVLTMNGLSDDAVPGVDEWDWYLSQRTDDPTKQLFSLTPEANKSGTVTLGTTSVFDDEYPDGFTPLNLMQSLKHVHLYVQERSTKAIHRYYLFDQYTREAEAGGS